MSGHPDLAAAAFHWLEYVGLLGGLGSFVVRRLASHPPRIPWARPPMAIAFAAAFAGGLGVITLEALEGSGSAAGALAFLIGGAGGWVRIVRVAAEGLALLFCVRGLPYVAPMTALAAASLALAGHSTAVEPPAGAEFADAIHVLSAGMWAGGILALATLRPPGGWRGPEARMLLGRFSSVALIAFGVTALTGVLRATEQLSGVSDLWTTPYGLVLGLKSAGVLAMLVLSSLAWRRGLPVARVEAGAAVAVAGLTALLAAFPFPA
ncbi:hypothetical protein EPN29_07015 [bacterium]|nr:MAG: hypothetical protein EPN29_07015 [bacterium]